MPERKRMPSNTKRLMVPVTRTLGTRKNARRTARRYRNDDLLVFREMSKISRQVAREYIEKLLGAA